MVRNKSKLTSDATDTSLHTQLSFELSLITVAHSYVNEYIPAARPGNFEDFPQPFQVRGDDGRKPCKLRGVCTQREAVFRKQWLAMTINPNLQSTHLELSVAVQGMRNPQVVCLPAGEVIFRFASTKRQTTGESIPSDQWARGAWWIREADYKIIIERFKTGRLSLGTVARSAAAVQPSWSNMDVSIKAYLLDDINVYVGRGSTQYRDVLPNGMCMTLQGWPDIEQIYIPGMGRNGATYRSIKVQRQKVISTDNFGF